MEDEIDLRKYILLLVNHWKWIVGFAIVFAGLAFVINQWVFSPTYTAKAILFIIQPQYTISFDSRFTTQNKTELLFYSPVDQLAVADDVILELYNAWSQDKNSTLSIDDLKGMLEVEDSTANSIDLLITSKDPKLSADLVNLWANILVAKTEDIYTNKASESENLLNQFDQATAERNTAEQALTTFQSQNELLLLQSQLTVTQVTYSQFLIEQANVTKGLENIEALQTQLSGLPPNTEVSLDNELTALLLQMKVYDVKEPFILNVGPEPFTSARTMRELQTQLELLSNVLIQREQQLALKLEPLQAKVLELQSQISTLEITQEQLNQNYRLASDIYLTLARKLEETNISNQVTTGSIRLASRATMPQKPSGPNTLLNTLIAGVIGGFLGVGIILGQSIWKEMTVQPNLSEAPST